jgi:hypothetical protein
MNMRLKAWAKLIKTEEDYKNALKRLVEYFMLRL